MNAHAARGPGPASPEDPVRDRPIIGVMGASRCDEATAAKAERVGALLASAGCTVLCGGGSGVMESAARGARRAGGLTIGILPGRDAGETPPNPHIDVPIYTGLSDARNAINVLSSRVVVAVGGGPGTLSEIALALRYGRPVVLLDSWSFAIEGYVEPPQLHRVNTPEEAVARVRAILERAPRSAGDGPSADSR